MREWGIFAGIVLSMDAMLYETGNENLQDHNKLIWLSGSPGLFTPADD